MIQNSPIRLLPEHLIDQIKAGEVVERPSALIKEILENSIDAGSKHLNLHIVENGLELVALEDDGVGMSFDDLPYAFARHATSKIIDYSDLFKLSSYGFRGEALASIASVSRLSCTSVNKSGSGGKIEIHGGETIAHTPIERDHSGTSLFIKDLFYNTPARLKFIKSKNIEKNAIKRIIDAFLLTAKEIAFSVRFDDQDKKIFPACSDDQSFVQRIEKLFFKRKDLASRSNLMYETRRDFENHHLQLHVSKQSFPGNSGKNHFLFANGRLFNDKRLHQSIIRSMPALWGSDNGHYVLFLNVPADQIDVNVHPNKTEIKFMRDDIIFAMLKASLKDLDALAISMQEDFTTKQTPQANDWQKFEKSEAEHHHPDSGLSQSPAGSQVINQNAHSHLPSGYRWLSGEHNHIIDESALVRLACAAHQDEIATGLVPLLINEPISCQNQKLSLDKLSSLGFDLEWIEEDLLALRAVATWLRPLPYLELCRYAIEHYDQQKLGFYQNFKLQSSLPDAVYGRLLASYKIENLKSQGIIKVLDQTTLQRLFHS
ncbi:MAG: hypothetical protein CME71_08430 [Halobacteriovorax sp.]|nr:hypothetical protein [Halobacteriovorax sp.]